MNKFSKIATLSIAGALVAGSIFAHGSENQSVKARQHVMSLQAYYLGQLGTMAKGDVEYDATAAQGAADSLVAITQLDHSTLWPPGTDSESDPNTRALPNLWTDYPDIIEKADALTQAVAAMQTAAGTDLDSLRAAMGPVGAACGACHKAYQKPR